MLLELINEIGSSLYVAAFILLVASFLWYRSARIATTMKAAEKVYEKPLKPYNFPHYFTSQELSEFDGEKNLHCGNPVYISVCGTVYDVTSHPCGRDLYGIKGSYHIFAGHEVTLALASMSIEPEYLDKLPSVWQGFSLPQRQIISDWVDKFDSKYDKVGFMKYESTDENAIVEKWSSSITQ